MEFLQQVRVLDPVTGDDRAMDVLLQADRIVAIGPSLTPPDGTDTVIVAAQNLIFAPALIDLYSRCGEPGYEQRETLASLAATAATGGFGQVNLLPTSQPAIDNPAMVSWLMQQLPTDAAIAIKPWAALTLDTKGQQLTALGELTQADIVGFSDGRAIADYALLRRILEYAAPLQRPIALWPKETTLVGAGLARHGVEALRMGLATQPTTAETVPLTAILELVAAIGTPVHLMRISTARSVELIAQAKQQGLPITASTTWLHLLYETQDLSHYDPNLRLDPPLGNGVDRQALITAIKTGILDAIAVDHSPYTYEEKTVAFGEAPPGALGLPLALPMLWSKLVEPGHLSAIELWRSLTCGPANCMQQPTTAILPETSGYLLFDPATDWIANADALGSLSHNTHLYQQSIQGRVLRQWRR
jgi:dihydroorotase